MKKGFATLTALMLSMMQTACRNLPIPSTTPRISSVVEAPARLADLDMQIVSWVNQGKPIGAEVLIVRDGEPLFHKAYGWSDRQQRRPMRPDSIFRVRSMSKPFIATAVLMLRDEEKLDLDDRVGEHLPEFNTERHGKITIRDMLSHTSGMPDHDYEEIGLPQPPGDYESLAALVADIARTLSNGPRGIYHYSSTNSVVLAELVARLSNMPFEQFLQQRIFAPLGMEDTHTEYDPGFAWSSRMNSTYSWSTETCNFERYWNPDEHQYVRYFRASGGVYSTTKDYARFMQMWLNGGELEGMRVISEASAAEGLRRHATGGSYGGYGLHMGIFNAPDNDNLGVVFGHAGSDGTLALAFPESRTLVMYFTQSRDDLVTSRFMGALSGLQGFERLQSVWRQEFRLNWRASTKSDANLEPKVIDQLVGRYRNSHPQGPQSMQLQRAGSGVEVFVEGRHFHSLRKVGDAFLSIDPCKNIIIRLTPVPEEGEGALELATENNMNMLFLPAE